MPPHHHITWNLRLPPWECWPNYRGHWARRARAVADYKEDCGWLLRDQRNKLPTLPLTGPIHVTLTFVLPDRRRRDLDNLIAAAKPALDALASVLKVDDSRFELTASRMVDQGQAALLVDVRTE